jgi:hypothetical protein
MALFKTETQQGVWISQWCERCWRYDDGGCEILKKALRRQYKPPQWQRKSRPKTIAEIYKCDEFGTQPPRIKRAEKRFEDVPMFEMGEHETHFVPVEGWPDKPRKDKTGDHA